jgi:hypothetical protein
MLLLKLLMFYVIGGFFCGVFTLGTYSWIDKVARQAPTKESRAVTYGLLYLIWPLTLLHLLKYVPQGFMLLGGAFFFVGRGFRDLLPRRHAKIKIPTARVINE